MEQSGMREQSSDFAALDQGDATAVDWSFRDASKVSGPGIQMQAR